MIMNDDLCSPRDHTLVAVFMDHASVVARADINALVVVTGDTARDIGNIHPRIFRLPQMAFDFARVLWGVNVTVHHVGERWLTIKQGMPKPRPLLQQEGRRGLLCD